MIKNTISSTHNIYNLHQIISVLQNLPNILNQISIPIKFQIIQPCTGLLFLFFSFKRTQTSLGLLLKMTNILLLMFQNDSKEYEAINSFS
jgi:hypothetical protein